MFVDESYQTGRTVAVSRGTRGHSGLPVIRPESTEAFYKILDLHSSQAGETFNTASPRVSLISEAEVGSLPVTAPPESPHSRLRAVLAEIISCEQDEAPSQQVPEAVTEPSRVMIIFKSREKTKT